MKGKENNSLNTCRMRAAAIAGLTELLMSDLANNPPEDFTEEEVAKHREVAQKAHENRNQLLELSEKGGAL